LAPKGHVRFRNCSFTYPHTGIRALKNFDLEIRPGEKVAVIGRTGSGKSTLAQLLLRTYDPSEGRVELDGRDLRDLDLQTLRDAISYVPQDVFLFSDTVAANIGFGMADPAPAAIEEAATKAVVDKEILGFPEGYATLVGERGVTLSGGQKQRISIARALVKRASLVVFDDCLSAVDARTEQQILEKLAAHLKDRTALIITHRLFTLLTFDRIVVLEDGVIVEQGTHEQLLSQKGPYYRLFWTQRSGEHGAMQ
ncbi:MAG: hypothetical protein RJA57_1982, partial [Bacteroidota bacterium]